MERVSPEVKALSNEIWRLTCQLKQIPLSEKGRRDPLNRRIRELAEERKRLKGIVK